MSSSDLLPTIEQLEALLKKAPAADLQRYAELAKGRLKRAWIAQRGPQADAYYSEADELLYGGAAGGGKTDLLVGLALTAHQSSVIFRAQSVDLDGVWERLLDVGGDSLVSKDSVKRVIKTADGRTIKGGHLGKPGSERDHQGRARDFIGFDEAAQLMEARVNFVMQWLRSTDPKQRKRVVFATNPPIPEIGEDGQPKDTGLGDWLVRWFAPWVDDMYPNPAEPGELRWCFMRSEGDQLVTIWVEGPGVYRTSTGAPWPDATEADIEGGEASVARSRTFIRSLAKDNLFLRGTGYVERLSGTPEPLRSMLLRGDFTVRGDDHPRQIIPTQWIIDAQERWLDRTEEDVIRLRQLVLYGDVAQGGIDSTVLAPLCETDYYDELIRRPGSATPTGKEVARLVLDERLDGSIVVLDGSGGWGGAARDLLEVNHKIIAEMHNAGAVDGSWTPDMLYKYRNLRAKMWWEFRLALDPRSDYLICLPPGTRLRTQLSAPHYLIGGKILQVESKEEIAKRIGGSTDEADAVVGAWQYRDQALAQLLNPTESLIERINGRSGKEYAGEAFDFEDPRREW